MSYLSVMPDPDTLARFVLATVLLELTPGPNMAFLATLAALRGPKAGAAMVAGIAAGLALVGLAAATGLAALVERWPGALAVLTWGGVAYLVWMAVEAWREASAGPSAAGIIEAGPADWFVRGVVINLLNPKAALFYVAVLPGFAHASAEPLWSVLVLTAVAVAIATAVHAGIVLLAGSLQPVLAAGDRTRTARRVMAVLLLGVAVWFAVSAL